MKKLCLRWWSLYLDCFQWLIAGEQLLTHESKLSWSIFDWHRQKTMQKNPPCSSGCSMGLSISIAKRYSYQLTMGLRVSESVLINKSKPMTRTPMRHNTVRFADNCSRERHCKMLLACRSGFLSAFPMLQRLEERLVRITVLMYLVLDLSETGEALNFSCQSICQSICELNISTGKVDIVLNISPAALETYLHGPQRSSQAVGSKPTTHITLSHIWATGMKQNPWFLKLMFLILPLEFKDLPGFWFAVAGVYRDYPNIFWAEAWTGIESPWDREWGSLLASNIKEMNITDLFSGAYPEPQVCRGKSFENHILRQRNSQTGNVRH